MDAILNPFRPGAGTQPPALLGREFLLQSFRINIERARKRRPGKSLMPTGLRGTGKTVLLNRFIREAAQAHFSTGFIEAPETKAFPGQLAATLQEVLIDLRGRSITSKLRKALGILKSFSLTLPGDFKIGLDIEPEAGRGDTGDLSTDLTQLFTAIGEAAAEQERGMLVAIDEIQYLSKDDFAAVITALHRSTQQDLPVVVVGAGLPQLPAIAGDAKSYAERLFEFPQIGSLLDVDARAALEQPAAEAGVRFESAALDIILDRTKSYPYFLQEYGAAAWNLAVRSPITARDVLAAEEIVTLQLEKSFFRVRFDRLTPKERSYVHALARLGPGEHRSSEVAADLGQSVESLGTMRARLIEKGILYSPEHGLAAFTVPLFDEFVRRVEAR
jgi:hypothetical protein